MLPQRLSVRHCEQGDAHLWIGENAVSVTLDVRATTKQNTHCVCVYDVFVGSDLSAVAVDVILYIHTHRTGALVQNGKLGLVVEESGHLRKYKHPVSLSG